MKQPVKKEERRRVLGGIVAACAGALCLGKSRQSHASTGAPDGNETLYHRTEHVDQYFRSLDE